MSQAEGLLVVNEHAEVKMDVNPAPNIFYAAKEGSIAKVQQYLDAGVNANIADYAKRTPLHIACVAGHTEVAKLLLDKGANVNARDVHDWTPLDEATRNHREDAEALIRKYGGQNGCAEIVKPTRLHQLECLQLVAVGDLENVKTLVEANIGVNFSDYDKRTPLHLAVAEGHFEVTQWLIQKGADKEAEDRWGTTPGDEAKKHHVRTGQDQITPLFFSEEDHEEGSYFTPFSLFYVGAEVVMFILFMTVVEYGEILSGDDHLLYFAEDYNTTRLAESTNQMTKYTQFMDVHVMIFIGFGFLMTFLRKNGYQSLGLTFLVSTFSIQWYVLCGGFFEELIVNGHLAKLHINLNTLILADFCCGAVLITYGVLLGKVSPFQLLFVAMLEIIFFTINESIGMAMGITDVGGSMVVHMFGAFFGLSASLVMKRTKALGNHENAPVYHSDMYAMIGTVFLWMFWPSFNGALASDGRQMRVTVNTVLSLSGSCVAGFVASHVIRREKKFDMVDVQNATLAGGVAMGTCADLLIGPGPALLIGLLSGVLSVFGYVHVQPWLESKIGLHDTCGVNNLHGMPSILGAVAGIVAITQATNQKYGDNQFQTIFTRGRSPGDQALTQLYFMIITLSISIFGGAFVGLIVNCFGALLDPLEDENLFKDTQHWEVPGVENPYYFDERGEIQRDPKTDGNVNKDVNLKLEGLIEKVRLMEEGSGPGLKANGSSGGVAFHIGGERKWESKNPSVSIEQMSCNDAAKWFESQDLQKVANIALQDKIDGAALIEFEAEDFTELGIPSDGYKRKIFTSKLKKLQKTGYQKRT